MNNLIFEEALKIKEEIEKTKKCRLITSCDILDGINYISKFNIANGYERVEIFREIKERVLDFFR